MERRLKLVGLELHSYCNRRCSWCSNRGIDRSFYKEMSDDVFYSVLSSLSSVDFCGTIEIAGYSEPMSSIDLLKKRVDELKKAIPNATVKVHTNGDYINYNNLYGLNIDKLNINDYDCMGAEACKKRLEEAGCTNIYIDTCGRIPRLRARHENIPRIEYRVDWSKHIKLRDRGGYFRAQGEQEIIESLRINFCIHPIDTIVIYYNGDVTSCTEFRPDNELHKDLILGNIADSDLIQLYDSPKALEIRKRLLSYNYSNFPYPCKKCSRSADYK